MRLLVTRPEPDAERTASALCARGCDVIVAPLLRVETLTPALGSGPWHALALTSANAMRAIEPHPRHSELIGLPVFVVGRRTSEAARAAGFVDVHSARGSADDLVRLIAARMPGGTLLYLAGEDRAADLANALAPHGVAVETVVVYRAARQTGLSPAAVNALASGGLDGVLHYSRRSAEAFLECASAAGVLHPALALVQYCISQSVAEPLAAAGARDLRIAAHPQEDALLHLVAAS